MKCKVLIATLLLCAFQLQAQKTVRTKQNFDFDWKFIVADSAEYAQPDYHDAGWKNVQLPHDWNISQEFDKKMGGAAAYLPEGIGWYRKTFLAPSSWKGKLVAVLFDGIFHQSDVYINGKHLGFHPYGFSSIEYDLTPYLNVGKENSIAVRVNCTGGRPRWYAGSGIYRHAWLEIVNPVHVATYGTYVTTPVISKEVANVKIEATVANSSAQKQTINIAQRVLDPSGKEVALSPGKKIVLDEKANATITQELAIKSPVLWTLDKPERYLLETIVKAGNKIVDVYKTSFGLRTFKFDKDNGFSLNGEHVKLKGMCLHQDAGSLGVAVPDRSYERRLEILKEYGCNAIRCSHNQPSPELLDMCDKMGFVVIDEAFDKWRSGYYEKYFDDWWQKDLGDMILRDRNHPCVALWSIGNELSEASRTSNEGVDRAKMLQDFVHKLEPTRPVMMALQNGHQDKFAAVTDVVGYNYQEPRMLADHKTFPDRIFLVSEELPYFRGEQGRLRSYTPLNAWQIVAANDFIAGGFIWSGVDYLGEAGWPSKGWPNGLFDICMFEKPRAAYHRAMWNAEPMVNIAVADPSLDIDHGRDLWQWPNIAAHWNFPESYKGLILEIRTTTNCQRVELYLNDKLMGTQKTENFTNNTIIWYLPYTPGKLEAKAFNGDKEVAKYQLVTSKAAYKTVVTPDRVDIKADGQDLSHIAIQLVDEDGNIVQTDNRKVTVTVEGEGRFLGIDNGDLRRERSFAGNELPTYFGKALAIVQSTRKAGKMLVNIQVEGVKEKVAVEINSK
jgi:beta-galactosidase